MHLRLDSEARFGDHADIDPCHVCKSWNSELLAGEREFISKAFRPRRKKKLEKNDSDEEQPPSSSLSTPSSITTSEEQEPWKNDGIPSVGWGVLQLLSPKTTPLFLII